MKIAALSDIHGNLEALKRVIDDVHASKVDTIICLGDIIGYGPFSKECLKIIREVSSLICIGNHELGALNIEKFSDISSIAATVALKHCITDINEEELEFIRNLPTRIESSELDITMAHGNITGPSALYYTADNYQVQEEFLSLNTRIGIVGHTHIPLVYNGRMFREKECTKQIATSGQSKVFLNPGSVGFPRDFDTRASYAIIDITETDITVCIKKVSYDVNITKKAMEKIGLPSSLITRLVFAT